MGGPEAGNVRLIPDEDLGKIIRGAGEYDYKLWPFRLKGQDNAIWFAFDAMSHPMNMLMEMWREYSPTAQIKRGHETLTYSKLTPRG